MQVQHEGSVATFSCKTSVFSGLQPNAPVGLDDRLRQELKSDL